MACTFSHEVAWKPNEEFSKETHLEAAEVLLEKYGLIYVKKKAVRGCRGLLTSNSVIEGRGCQEGNVV